MRKRFTLLSSWFLVRVQFRGSDVPLFRGSDVPVFRGSGVPLFRGSGVPM